MRFCVVAIDCFSLPRAFLFLILLCFLHFDRPVAFMHQKQHYRQLLQSKMPQDAESSAIYDTRYRFVPFSLPERQTALLRSTMAAAATAAVSAATAAAASDGTSLRENLATSASKIPGSVYFFNYEALSSFLV
jgi:hypothetical protein